MTSVQTAAHLGVPVSSLRATASLLGIEYATHVGSKTTVAMIRKCADLGMSARQAADQLRVSETNLRTAAGLLGIRFRGHNGRALNTVTLTRHSANDPFGMLA